jgi:hypothetical protein
VRPDDEARLTAAEQVVVATSPNGGYVVAMTSLDWVLVRIPPHPTTPKAGAVALAARRERLGRDGWWLVRRGRIGVLRDVGVHGVVCGKLRTMSATG